MSKVTEKQVEEFLDELGVDKTKEFGKSKNLYKILGIVPEVDDEGNRLATVYEILGTPPQLRNGKEVPIVFAIKNRVKKLGRYQGSERLFFYAHQNKNKEVSSLEATLENLKKKYKHALFVGNTDEAVVLIDLIDSMTGGHASEIVGSFYNYAVFYKKMKKQLLMDMFVHFFLTYFLRYRNNIKQGIINSSKRFKPYFENPSITLSGNELNQIFEEEGFVNSSAFNFSDIKSFKVDTDFYEVKPSRPNKVFEGKQTAPNVSIIEKPKIPVVQEKKRNQENKEEKQTKNELKSFIKVPKHVKSTIFKLFDDMQPDQEEKIENKQEENKSFEKTD